MSSWSCRCTLSLVYTFSWPGKDAITMSLTAPTSMFLGMRMQRAARASALHVDASVDCQVSEHIRDEPRQASLRAHTEIAGNAQKVAAIASTHTRHSAHAFMLIGAPWRPQIACTYAKFCHSTQQLCTSYFVVEPDDPKPHHGVAYCGRALFPC